MPRFALRKLQKLLTRIFIHRFAEFSSSMYMIQFIDKRRANFKSRAKISTKETSETSNVNFHSTFDLCLSSTRMIQLINRIEPTKTARISNFAPRYLLKKLQSLCTNFDISHKQNSDLTETEIRRISVRYYNI